MGKLTKKKLKKHLKGVHKKKHKKKTLAKEIDEHVRAIVIRELEAHGDEGMEKIVIDDVSIEISSEDPEIEASSARSATAPAARNAAARCCYYCYVIGGTKICRQICW